MADGASALAPSTTPDSTMPPYNEPAGGVLGGAVNPPPTTQLQTPQQPTEPAQTDQQIQPQTTPAYQDPEMVMGAAHHNALVQHLLSAAHAISNTLGGSETYKVTTDANGNPQIAKTDATEGEKWGRIALGILGGAAKGFAAGQGPGGAARAISAGFDQGQQVRQQQQQAAEHNLDEAQKQLMFKANHAALDQKYVMNTEAMRQNNITFTQQQMDRANAIQKAKSDAPGSEDIGDFQGVKDLPSFTAKYPDALKGHVQDVNHYLNLDPIFDPKTGQQTGTHVSIMNRPMGEQIMQNPPPLQQAVFNPKTNAIEYKDINVSQGTTYNAYATASKAQDVENSNLALKVADLKAKQNPIPKTIPEMQLRLQQSTNPAEKAQLQAAITAQQNTPEARASVAQKQAETRKANAEANEADFKMGKGPQGSALVDAVASGHVTADRLGYLIARNPDLIAAVAQKDPSFDTAKAGQYPATYKEFTSSKPGTAGAALNNGATALKHLKELDDMNTVASHIPHTPAYTAYMDKVETVASELAKFYGNSTIPAIAGIRDKLATTAPGNRHAAIETQAQSMGDKLDSYEQQWSNAAPSAAYEAPMPQIDQKAKDARAALDPNYKARLVQEQQGTTPTPTPTPAPAPGGTTPPIEKVPPGHDTTFANGQVWRNVNGVATRIK